MPLAEQKIDPLVFRQVMGCFATGIAVATTSSANGRPVGVTINSLTSVSLEPTLILFCLERDATSFPAFEASTSFAINILSEDQRNLSATFALPVGDHWAGVDWSPGQLGVPLINKSLAWLECTRHATYDGGDHLIFVGRVTALGSQTSTDPLLYFRGQYRSLSPQST